jgi:DNA-binding transcriptional MerR regulator
VDRGKEEQGGYSIRLVSKLTGLSADTVRAWERRYGAVTPARTEGNTRRYSAQDVRRLRLLQQATGQGHRIGDIANLGEAALQELTRSTDESAVERLEAQETGISGEEASFAALRAAYFEAISQFEARKAQQQLARAAALIEPLHFVLRVVLPIMRETGDRWHRGEFTVAQEHLVSMQQRGLVQSLLMHAAPHRGAPKVIVTTPPGDQHEFGALAGAMLASLRGYETLYLGPDVPIDDLLHATRLWGPDVVLLSLVRQGTAAETRRQAEGVEQVARTITTWVGLSPDHPAAPLLKKAQRFSDFADLDLALTELLR